MQFPVVNMINVPKGKVNATLSFFQCCNHVHLYLLLCGAILKTDKTFLLLLTKVLWKEALTIHNNHLCVVWDVVFTAVPRVMVCVPSVLKMLYGESSPHQPPVLHPWCQVRQQVSIFWIGFK